MCILHLDSLPDAQATLCILLGDAGSKILVHWMQPLLQTRGSAVVDGERVELHFHLQRQHVCFCYDDEDED